MKVFFTIIKIALKITARYRFTFLMSVIIHPVFMILGILVFSSLYRHAGTAMLAGFELAQMVWYLAGILFIWSAIWNSTDSHIAFKVLHGDLTQDLLRPLSIFKLELGMAIGHRTQAFLLEFLPDMIILPLIYFPSFMTIWSVLKFIPVLIGAFLIFFHINFLIGLLSFVMKTTKAIASIRYILVATMGGGWLPLDFYPPAFNAINRYLPFQYIFYQPLRVMLNTTPTQSPEGYLTIIGVQAAWIIGLHILTRVLWFGAYRKYCAVGG
ncbi:MAG: ABC-2 family transporter protein [Spirochaetales bacterium]|nr:ABC-2 family transporter protein [Spirochaetales bacterium]